MATLETLQLGTEVTLVDTKTGKLTRQGLLFFQNITAISPQVNTNTTDLSTHTSFAATESSLGHVKKAAAVTDPGLSEVSVDSADASDLSTAITLANELKSEVNLLKSDVNNAITQLNALMAALRTSGALSS